MVDGVEWGLQKRMGTAMRCARGGCLVGTAGGSERGSTGRRGAPPVGVWWRRCRDPEHDRAQHTTVRSMQDGTRGTRGRAVYCCTRSTRQQQRWQHPTTQPRGSSRSWGSSDSSRGSGGGCLQPAASSGSRRRDRRGSAARALRGCGCQPTPCGGATAHAAANARARRAPSGWRAAPRARRRRPGGTGCPAPSAPRRRRGASVRLDTKALSPKRGGRHGRAHRNGLACASPQGRKHHKRHPCGPPRGKSSGQLAARTARRSLAVDDGS